MLSPDNSDVLVERLQQGLFVTEASYEHTNHLMGLGILGLPRPGFSSEPGRNAGNSESHGSLLLKRKPWLGQVWRIIGKWGECGVG